jgi:phage terminase large subunit GpA-like protein
MKVNMGPSTVPEKCPHCGHAGWKSIERLHTNDSRGADGFEDWALCEHCGQDSFYPVAKDTSHDNT